MGEILIYRNFLKTYKTRGYRINHLKDYKKYFPIKSSPLLAGIIADLICDGHLQGNPIWRADFTSKSIGELKYFEKRINLLFGISCRIRKCTSNKFGKTFNAGLNCSPITRILFLCGTPAGQKVVTKFKLPNWIRNDKECFREFCKRMFTCEGTVMHEKNRKTPQIRLEMWKSKEILKNGTKFISDVCTSMKRYFGINSTITFPKSRCIRRDNIITTKIKLYILGDSVIKFYNEIGFDGIKQQTLKGYLPNIS